MTIILPFLAAIMLMYLIGVWLTLYHLMKFRIPRTANLARHNPSDKSLLIIIVTVSISCALFLALCYLTLSTPWSEVGEMLEEIISISLP